MQVFIEKNFQQAVDNAEEFQFPVIFKTEQLERMDRMEEGAAKVIGEIGQQEAIRRGVKGVFIIFSRFFADKNPRRLCALRPPGYPL